MKKVIVLAAAALCGCASTGVVPTDEGKYMVARQSAGGIFVAGDTVKAEMYVEANDFCRARGLVVQTVNVESHNATPFVRTSGASLEFRCVPAAATAAASSPT